MHTSGLSFVRRLEPEPCYFGFTRERWQEGQ